MKIKKGIILLCLYLLSCNTNKEKRLLNSFREADVSGCACWFYNNPKDLTDGNYILATRFKMDYQERFVIANILGTVYKIYLTNTTNKTNQFGIESYEEEYSLANIELTIKYQKESRTGYEADLYDVDITLKYFDDIQHLKTKAICGC